MKSNVPFETYLAASSIALIIAKTKTARQDNKIPIPFSSMDTLLYLVKIYKQTKE